MPRKQLDLPQPNPLPPLTTPTLLLPLLPIQDEQYSSLVPRKQLDLARRVKEKHSYVARDFDAQVRTSDQPAIRQAIALGRGSAQLYIDLAHHLSSS